MHIVVVVVVKKVFSITLLVLATTRSARLYGDLWYFMVWFLLFLLLFLCQGLFIVVVVALAIVSRLIK